MPYNVLIVEDQEMPKQLFEIFVNQKGTLQGLQNASGWLVRIRGFAGRRRGLSRGGKGVEGDRVRRLGERGNDTQLQTSYGRNYI